MPHYNFKKYRNFKKHYNFKKHCQTTANQSELTSEILKSKQLKETEPLKEKMARFFKSSDDAYQQPSQNLVQKTYGQVHPQQTHDQVDTHSTCSYISDDVYHAKIDYYFVKIENMCNELKQNLPQRVTLTHHYTPLQQTYDQVDTHSTCRYIGDDVYHAKIYYAKLENICNELKQNLLQQVTLINHYVPSQQTHDQVDTHSTCRYIGDDVYHAKIDYAGLENICNELKQNLLQQVELINHYVPSQQTYDQVDTHSTCSYISDDVYHAKIDYCNRAQCAHMPTNSYPPSYMPYYCCWHSCMSCSVYHDEIDNHYNHIDPYNQDL